jgi:hypothetical protein
MPLTTDKEIKICAMELARHSDAARAMKQDGVTVDQNYKRFLDWINSHDDSELAMRILKSTVAGMSWKPRVETHLQLADENYRLFATGSIAEPPPKPIKAPAKKQAAKKKASATSKKKWGSTKPS